jgi:hypothetical protein
MRRIDSSPPDPADVSAGAAGRLGQWVGLSGARGLRPSADVSCSSHPTMQFGYRLRMPRSRLEVPRYRLAMPRLESLLIRLPPFCIALLALFVLYTLSESLSVSLCLSLSPSQRVTNHLHIAA